jgi:hypothetical protein
MSRATSFSVTDFGFNQPSLIYLLFTIFYN